MSWLCFEHAARSARSANTARVCLCALLKSTSHSRSHLSVCAFTHSHWRSFLRGLSLRCVGEGDSGGFWQRKAPYNRLACWVRTFALRHLVGVFYATFWVHVLCYSTCRQNDGRADGDNVVSMMRPPCRMQFLWPFWAPCRWRQRNFDGAPLESDSALVANSCRRVQFRW